MVSHMLILRVCLGSGISRILRFARICARELELGYGRSELELPGEDGEALEDAGSQLVVIFGIDRPDRSSVVEQSVQIA